MRNSLRVLQLRPFRLTEPVSRRGEALERVVLFVDVHPDPGADSVDSAISFVRAHSFCSPSAFGQLTGMIFRRRAA